jgi:ABC-type oligopeptide transport system substrate-binding subunit/class 3 adenylate cyclase
LRDRETERAMTEGSGAEQRARLEQAIAHMESQRSALGDAVVDASLAALQKELHELEAAGRAEQRKLVTVLFMDTVGSTEMTRDLDPEENLAIMDTAMQRLSPPVEQYGGRVVRYMGDGFKAVFGLPVAHENDARMAVRAGLGILEAARAYAREVSGYQVRVGIDTGWVAVGGLTEGEGTIMGMAVNLAARLESAAPPGGLLISQHTYQHVRGLFDMRPLDPVEAKGFPDPVPVYQVLRAKARSFRTRSRGVEGVETRMIGRDREMNLLQERFLDAVEEREGQFVTVVGEAGLGKSRLLYEFENWVDLQNWDTLLFRGRALPETQRLPYGLLRDLFAFRFNIQDDDSAEQVRQKMVAGFEDALGAVAEAERKAHFVGHLLGYDFVKSPHLETALDEPQQVRDRSLTFVGDYFAAVAGQDPVLVLLEDLHWADESTLNALAQLSPALQTSQVMFLAAARDTLFERRPSWMEGQAFHLRLDLAPLSKRNSRRLVTEVLQRLEEVPDALRDLVVGSAEGNPFYVEELIKMLLEAGAIVKSEPKWQLRPDKLATAQVPSTLTGVLQARLEGLPHEQRLLLQQASVIGRVFWDRALAYLNTSEEGQLEEASILDGLEALRDKEMVFRRDLSAFAGASEHTFKHALLREVSYESVLMRVRRSYHAMVADWLITQSGERVGEVTGLIAAHLQQAGKEHEAVEYLLQAGDRARDSYAHQEAIDSYRRAVNYLGDVGDHVRAARVYMKLGLSYHAILDFDSAQEAYEKGFSEWQQAAETEAAERISQAPAPHPIRAVSSRSPTRLDSTISNGTHSAWFINQLMSGLLLRTAEDELVPDIARSWEVLDGGRTYVFHLRDDVKWSDGVPVTAADFEFAWKRLLHPENDQGQGEMLFDIGGAKAFKERKFADPDLLGVHIIDSCTLVVKLEEPCGYFLHIMAAAETKPIPRHVVERYGPSWTEPGNIVTNGPFKLESMIPGKSVTLERYKDYHGRYVGNASRVQIKIARGLEVLEMYERDELDFFAPFSSLSLAEGRRVIERHPNDYVSLPEPVTRYVAFDVTRPPFDDPRVRQALVLASDRRLLANSLTMGSDSPAGGGMVPLGVAGHVPGIALPFDPDLAGKKLAQAGYSGGRGLPTVAGLCPSTHVPLAVAENLAAQWQMNLDFQMSFEALSTDEISDRLARNLPNLWVGGWRVNYPDPDSILRHDVLLLRTGWRNERYEALVEGARRTADQVQRMATYRQAEQILVDEAPIVPISYPRLHMMVKPWLPGLPFSTIDDVILKDVVIEPH